MRSSAVGPDRAVDRSSAPPPRAANLYACHEVMGATACRPFRVKMRKARYEQMLSALRLIADMAQCGRHGSERPEAGSNAAAPEA